MEIGKTAVQISNEIKELFQFIDVYKPRNQELETFLQPFLPDYVPSIGDVDPFIKVLRSKSFIF